MRLFTYVLLTFLFTVRIALSDSHLQGNVTAEGYLKPLASGQALGGATQGWSASLAELFGLQANDTSTGNVDTLATAGKYQLRLTGAAPVLRGIANGAAGKEIVVINATGSDVVVKNQDANPTAANRILTGSGADLTLPADAAFRFDYDAASSRWRVAGGGGGTAFNAIAPISYNSGTKDLSCIAATGSVAGCLSAADWTTFNGKQTQDGDLDAIAALTGTGYAARTGTNTWAMRTLQATAPVQISNGDGTTGNPVITCVVATGSVAGCLSASDWNTFNGKQAALSFGALSDAGTDGIVVTGGSGAVIGSGTSLAQHVADTTHNGYVSSTDWTAFNAKVASTRAINTTAPITGGGDLSADRTLACNVASGSVAGCLASADWTTFNGKMTNPMTTAGDTVVGGASGTPARLAKGNNGQVYREVGGTSAWTDDLSNTNMATLDTAANSWAKVKADNYSAASTVGDWAAYSGATLTGGSPNTTCTRNTSSPIDGVADFLMTLTTGATRATEGCSLLVNIPTAFRGQTVRVSFPYITTGTVAAGDFVVTAYDVTNSVALPASATVSAISGTAGTVYATFSAQSSAAQLRIGLNIARTSTGAATVEWDDFKVEQDLSQANVPVSDWAPCTGFTPNNFGIISSSVFYCRRVGDTREVSGKWISGTPAGASGSLTIPDVIDTSKMGTVASFQLGLGYNATGGPGQLYPGNATVIFYDGSDSGKVYFANGGTASTDVFIKTNASTFVNAGVGFSVKFSYPVSGWSSGGGTSPILSLSDWKSFSETITATTTNPTLGTPTLNQAMYRRVGDSVQITYILKGSGGTNGSGTYLFALPSGLVADTSKVNVSTSNAIYSVGNAVETSNGFGLTNWRNGTVGLYDATHVWISLTTSNVAAALNVFNSANYAFFNDATEYDIYFTATIPISGWTSTSSGTLTAPRTQAWLATLNGFAATNTAIARFTNIIGTTGNITVTQSSTLGDSITINEEGIYSVSENVSLGNTGVAGISINSNQLTTNLATITNTNRLCAAQVSAADVTAACGATVHMNVGDVLRVHAASSGNSNGANGADSTFIVTKVSN